MGEELCAGFVDQVAPAVTDPTDNKPFANSNSRDNCAARRWRCSPFCVVQPSNCTVCSHYGLRIGLRHARKHLGWALDVAAACSRAPSATIKAWRQTILTSEDAVGVHRSLQDAFDDLAWSAAA